MSNGVFAAAAVVTVAAAGIGTYVGLQEVRDLRGAIGTISTKLDKTDATAAQASATATQASATAIQAKEIADQARAVAMTVKASADRAAAVGSAGAAIALPTAAQATGSADIKSGREFALLICSACHVVSPDQNYAPTRSPQGPDFRDIANMPAATDKALRDFLAKPHGNMPDLRLPDFQVTALVDYMMSLRDRH